MRILLLALPLLAGCGCVTERRLPRSVYFDKLQGAWIGQMVGVSYGAPYEFRATGHIDDGPIRPWHPEYIANALAQDDLYVEMTWLMCLEDHGLDVTPAQAGAAFAATEFRLWHANEAGRENVRAGILPPASGAPAHNPHANDIDYQIEADAIGILCPGLPQEANRLGWMFGHIMNYGDGGVRRAVRAGHVQRRVFRGGSQPPCRNGRGSGSRPSPMRTGSCRRGLACIPAESRYAQCIRDVVAWYRAYPQDWRVVWQKVEAKYNDDRDCEPGKPFNINAHLNGAYVVMGLLYGGDDFWRVCEIAVRCGQDSDCNPATAAGVWGCMHGLSHLPREAYAGLDAHVAPAATTGPAPATAPSTIAEQRFRYTRYNYRELLETCRTLTEKLIVRTGGRIRPDAYVIRVQGPAAGATGAMGRAEIAAGSRQFPPFYDFLTRGRAELTAA